MRINLDRLSTLAGIPNGKPSINENVEAGMEETMYEDEDITFEGDGMEEEDEGMEEMIEIDEVMLVQELRRAKRLMNESRQSKAKKQAIFENNLKRIIDEEVQSVMDEMNLTSGWVYGNNTPKRSRKGYTAQGSMIPGIGFQRR